MSIFRSRALAIKLFVVICVFVGGCEPSPPAWVAITVPLDAGPGSAQPHLAMTDKGQPVLSWVNSDADMARLRFSVLIDNEWSAPAQVASGADWFVNWADFPSVEPLSGDTWAAHWLAKKPGGTYAYDVVVATSSDAGASWSAPVSPHTDATPTEHGFVTLFPLRDAVGVVWLDGRHTEPDSHDEHDTDTGTEQSGVADAHGGMTLRSAAVLSDGRLRQELEIDNLVCDCCQTDVAMTESGPLVVYRDRTEAQTRDIYTASLINDAWQPNGSVADDAWTITGCPVNGPAVAVHDNEVVVAWFTAAGGISRVRAARSVDGGRNFAAPVDIDDQKPFGRVDIVLLDDSRYLVSWLRRTPQGAVLAVRVVSDDIAGAIHTVAAMSGTRSAGVPQMTLRGDELIFAWTVVESADTHVTSARMRID